MARRTKNVDQTWIKNHPLEGDGLVTGFYNFLYKRNTKTLKPCKDVFIPDTIVFDHNFPRGWYTSDLKAKEISKKQGKELDAASIASSFSQLPHPSLLIVASYMCSYEVENDQGESDMCTQVEFFNEDSLKEFVARKTKREGILQRFLVPKGHRNSVIQAMWSPVIFSCKRRTNVHAVTDKVLCERDPYSVAVTYEGPSHFSEEGNCAIETTLQIKEICKNIVEHFQNTEHKFITRMVLYFKVDDKNQLWLLWCGSLRVSDRGTPSQMPVNLAAVFTSPALQGGSAAQEERLLHEADMRHLAMTHDAIFYETFVRDKSTSPSRSRSPAASRALKAPDGDDPARSSPTADDGRGGGGQAGSDAAPTDRWSTLPEVEEQYRELCADRELVLGAMEDVFYEAYGHYLRHEPGPYIFEVERKVAQTLTEEQLHDLMSHLRIDHATPTEDGVAENDELVFSVPSVPHTPVARLGEEASKWVRRYYAAKENELRDEALTVLQTMNKSSQRPPPAAEL